MLEVVGTAGNERGYNVSGVLVKKYVRMDRRDSLVHLVKEQSRSGAARIPCWPYRTFLYSIALESDVVTCLACLAS